MVWLIGSWIRNQTRDRNTEQRKKNNQNRKLRIAVTKTVGKVPEEKGSGVWAFLLLNQRSKDRFTSIKDLCRTVEREDSLFRVKKEDFFEILVEKPKTRQETQWREFSLKHIFDCGQHSASWYPVRQEIYSPFLLYLYQLHNILFTSNLCSDNWNLLLFTHILVSGTSMI